MNQNIRSKLLELANETGLQLDEQTGSLFGIKNGYSLHISAPAQQNQYFIFLSVSKGGALPQRSELKQAAKQSRALTTCGVQRYLVTFGVRGGSHRKLMSNMKTALEDLTQFLRANGYASCCQNCGSTDQPIDCYTVSGIGAILCESCFASRSTELSQKQQTELGKRGNVLTGIVGALLGSLLGAAVIVILGQLGYVAMLSGIVIAVCTLKGYELLGGKLNVAGVILSGVIILGMIYVGNRVDWAITVANYFSVDMFTAFRSIPELVSEGYIDSTYYFNLVLVYLFAIGGAIPTIMSAVKKKKQAYITEKMQSTAYSCEEALR